jgi:hypothetical protein
MIPTETSMNRCRVTIHTFRKPLERYDVIENGIDLKRGSELN